MKLTVNVTELDIRRGKPGNMLLCPVARAVRRAFNKAGIRRGEVLAHWTWIDLDQAYKSRRALVPAKVRRFMDSVDGGRIVKPIKFQLNFREI